jgi:DNA-binding response OmpR family regulator
VTEATARVLVVEDDHEVRQLYADILVEAGFVVRTATTSDAASAIVGREPVDVVTIDIGELGSGLALATFLNGRQSRPRLIAVTGRRVDVADQARFDRFLLKPLLPEQLVQTVRAVLEGV